MIIVKQYEAADLPIAKADPRNFTEEVSIPEIQKRIRTVIKTEAPITEWLLIKRVINSFQVYKAGAKIRPFMQEILDDMDLNYTEDETGMVYWSDRQDPENYNIVRIFGKYEETCRDVTLVPDAEIANALIYNLQAEDLDLVDLFRNTANFLGYTRMGTNVRLGLERGLQYAKREKKIRVEKGEHCILM